VTLAGRGSRATSVAVGAGRILALGTARDTRPHAGRSTERVDCRGAAIVPGLIDPHLHLFALAARVVNLDCATFGTVDELLAAVRARAARLPPAAWLRGEGLDESRLDRLPTPAELDAAAGRRPVRLRHRSRHASLLGGVALGRIGVDRRGGVPTGLVAGREEELGRLVGPLLADAIAVGLHAAGLELAALGVTTVADATPRTPRSLGPLRRAMQERRFPLRVFAMRRAGSPAWRATLQLAPGPVKLMVEETPAGLRPRPGALARRVSAAARRGNAVAVHCLGASTLVAALAAFAALPRRWRRLRHRLEHVAECPPPLVGAIAALGLTVVTNPAFVHWRGDAYLAETAGVARAWLYRARTLADAGIALAGASDAPAVPPSPWVGIAAARARRTRAGVVLGAAERLDPDAALRLFTTGAAFALGADALGRLVTGGVADVVVVEPDPLRAPPDEVADARVRLALVGGRRVWPA
jgi:predicted amidohydrolase YtcJ